MTKFVLNKNMLIALALSLIFTILSLSIAWLIVKTDAKESFAQETHHIFEDIENKLSSSSSSVDNLIAHFISTPYTDENSFSSINKHFMQNNPFISASAYFYHTNGDNLHDFEKEMDADGYAGFYVKEISDNKFKPVEKSKEHLALMYIEPSSIENTRLLGLDILTDCKLLPTLKTVISDNKTKGFYNPSGLNEAGTYWVFKPLFSTMPNEQKSLIGMFAVSIELKKILHDTDLPNNTQVWLYSNNSELLIDAAGKKTNSYGLNLSIEHSMETLGHPLHFRVEKRVPISQLPYLPFILALTGSMGITFLLVYLAYSFTSRTQWLIERNNEITDQFSISTTDLESAENELEASLKKLRDQEEKYRSLVENTSEGFWMIDTRHTIIEVNDSLSRMLQYSKEEMLGNSIFDFVDEENKKIFELQTKQISDKRHFRNEINLLKKNGDLLPIIMEATTLCSSNSELLGAFAFATDISEQKNLQRKLKLAANVFSHAIEGIVITDKDATILDANNAFTLITGYTKEDVVGKNCNILQSGYHTKEFYSSIWESLSKNSSWEGEVLNRRKDGAVYTELLKISAVKDTNNTTTHYIGLLSDVTLLKEKVDKLIHIAHYDALTKIPNRLLFFDRLTHAMAQSKRRDLNMALLYIDLDGFKEVNDTYGHTTGDKLLIEISKIMSDVMRESDTVARLGGDEFAALLVDLQSKNDAIAIIDRLIKDISEPILINGEEIQVTASVGLTFYPQPEVVDTNSLILQADEAMYKAKELGKNRYYEYGTIV